MDYKISKNTIEDLKACIMDVVAHYYPTKGFDKKKRKISICCPFHGERHPSMSVDARGLYYCFSCGAKGDTFSLVAHEEGLDAKRDFLKIAQIINSLSGGRYLINGVDPNCTPGEARPVPKRQEPPKQVEYIPDSMVAAAHAHVAETSLYMFLCRYWPQSEVDRVMDLYRVGASKYVNPKGGRAVAYPHINNKGQCVDIKLMHLSPKTGKRKDADPLYTWTEKDGTTKQISITWVLSAMKKSHLRAPWCGFGSHLLSLRPGVPIGIVESEKSALILTLAYPERLWIGTGGKPFFNEGMCAQFAGREIIVCPDRDGIGEWEVIAKSLPMADVIKIDTTISRYPGESKDDLADIVLRSMTGAQAPANDSKKSPARKEAEAHWAEVKRLYPECVALEQLPGLTPLYSEPLKF